MPFAKGNHASPGRPKGSKDKRTIWFLESLKQNGFDYEKALAKALRSGDHKLAELLIRLAPVIGNAPKHDVAIEGVETLVINRYASPASSEDKKA